MSFEDRVILDLRHRLLAILPDYGLVSPALILLAELARRLQGEYEGTCGSEQLYRLAMLRETALARTTHESHNIDETIWKALLDEVCHRVLEGSGEAHHEDYDDYAEGPREELLLPWPRGVPFEQIVRAGEKLVKHGRENGEWITRTASRETSSRTLCPLNAPTGGDSSLAEIPLLGAGTSPSVPIISAGKSSTTSIPSVPSFTYASQPARVQINGTSIASEIQCTRFNISTSRCNYRSSAYQHSPSVTPTPTPTPTIPDNTQSLIDSSLSPYNPQPRGNGRQVLMNWVGDREPMWEPSSELQRASGPAALWEFEN
ncbi:uncharacterized protein BCR38DRAFT_484379 [Pseudomassariella vexata]|uniref:Chromo domain-containing protein n=1 Tax=Pseudomassariella vexata TaxID=1141098 RepID=A0A1Y2E0M3_9PEZI|nr:uncharacterized protein BCR38DRAFT_484379 [Pseudomassariella vexata]ORY64904.1 hypothetical protein BCR38DRAFT_484379 [Pseudomassariella vexata]